MVLRHLTKQTPGRVTEVIVIDGRPQKEKTFSHSPRNLLMFSHYTGQLPAAENENNYGYKKEVQWLDNVKELISKEKLKLDDNISWAAYHALNEWQLFDYQPAITSLMPMFLENAHSAPMIFHGMILFDIIICTCKADSMAISRYTW